MAIQEQVREFIQRSFVTKADALGMDDPLLDTGVIDSTGIFELVTFLEDEFGIAVPDEDIVPENFETVARIAAFVEGKRAG